MIVDFVHDVTCPWCRIGYTNLKTAAKSFPDDPLTIRLRPFLLNPNIPEAGVDFKRYMAHITGNNDLEATLAPVLKSGEAAGLTYHFDRIQILSNSMPAHMALTAAPEADRERLLEALHTAYFEAGRDIGQRETLLAIVTEIGLDPKAIGAALSYPQFAEMVKEQVDVIGNNGVERVPFFVFNDTLSTAGAYPAPQLAQAWAKAQELAADAAKSTDAPAPAETPVSVDAPAPAEAVTAES